MAERLLVVDDEEDIRELLDTYLTGYGFEVRTVASGAQMRAALREAPCDLVLLDLGLPGEDGLTLARELRADPNIGIIIVTGRGQPVDRIIGLEVGADDYVAKPFNPRELLARIRAVLRRTTERAEHRRDPAPRTIRFSGWTLEPSRRRLLNPEGAEVSLTGGEYDLLVALVDRANRVLTRDMLLDLLRGRQAGPFDRAIDVAISRLRRKLEDDGRHAQIIKTVRGGGYVLASDVVKE